MKVRESSAGTGETKMAEYVEIENLVLINPLEQAPPETAIAIINFVELAEAYDQLTLEVI